VVVCVVAPPYAEACGAVETQVFPGPPLHAPLGAPVIDVADVGRQQLLARVSNNVNQIARHANAGDEFPQDAKAVLAYVREVAMRIDRTIEGLM
jgi:hypothetical protein